MHAHKREKNTPNLYGIECQERFIFIPSKYLIKTVTLTADDKG